MTAATHKIGTSETPADYINEAVKRAAVVRDLPAGTAALPIGKIGVIGAGTMGGGIAMNFASIGLPVRMVETSKEALDRGLALMRKNYERSAQRGRFPMAEVDARMGRVSGSLAMDDLSDCDLVIEAVFEDIELKKSIFTRLDKVARPGAVLATNTSGLDIDKIAAATTRPEDVIGMHFFSPANVMKLVEVVRADKTSASVIATAMHMSTKIGKIPVLVGVCPGFVGNRMLHHRQVQATRLLAQGALPWDIDAAFHAFGFKMGPFEMSDLAGLDIGWSKGRKTNSPLRDALCEMDRRGQKTGAGFYDYDSDRRPQPSPVVEKLIRETVATDGRPARKMSEAEIIEICVYPMINEAAHILAEKKAQRPSDIDVVWCYGYGWPMDKGGPMYFADDIGLQPVIKVLERLSVDQPYYKPAPLLRQLADQKRGFRDLTD